MKTVAIWSGVSALAFVVVGTQLGMLHRHRDEAPSIEEPAPAPAPAPLAAVFPDDLAPAAQARPVPAAADFTPGPGVHPLLYLRLNGTVHAWQEALRDDWAADTVAATELVVIVGVPKKTLISHHTYRNNAPPITRYQFELEISVIEAKTGRILANRLFRNVPRPLERLEAWQTTAIGRTVTQQQVFNWVSRMSRQGYPESAESAVIVTQMD